ncbi:unnamed protein product [Rotaria sordida]|uniref:TH1 domain-containing protein n=1 Tax=Rotaria sordida TaxID=392033 RepID=A0A819FPC9_9BILA|nr:unnamed protein product [Rotaria sordida]
MKSNYECNWNQQQSGLYSNGDTSLHSVHGEIHAGPHSIPAHTDNGLGSNLLINNNSMNTDDTGAFVTAGTAGQQGFDVRTLGLSEQELRDTGLHPSLVQNGRQLPLDQYKINYDPNPIVIRKQIPVEMPTYKQQVIVRYLRPPTPPSPGPLIIKEVREPQAAAAPPIVIRTRAPREKTPPPIIIREAPPNQPYINTNPQYLTRVVRNSQSSYSSPPSRQPQYQQQYQQYQQQQQQYQQQQQQQYQQQYQQQRQQYQQQPYEQYGPLDNGTVNYDQFNDIQIGNQYGSGINNLGQQQQQPKWITEVVSSNGTTSVAPPHILDDIYRAVNNQLPQNRIMNNDLLTNKCGNVQTLRNMWTKKVEEEQKSIKQKVVTGQSYSQISQKKFIQDNIQIPTNIDKTIINNESKTMNDNEKPSNIESIEQSSINETDDYLPLPTPPSSIIFQHQAQSIITPKPSIIKMFDNDKKKTSIIRVKSNGIRHWHLARHVFRSGLIFSSLRRASDSIIPILMKTNIAQYHSRTESLDSIHTQTPFQTLIDYLSYNNNDNINLLENKTIVKRTTSDTSACIQRNTLDDTIAQYEIIMRHLKNYNKFKETYPIPTRLSSEEKSLNTKKILKKKNEFIQQNSTNKSIIRNSQTQSLARNVGRTFTEFFMNDLLLSNTSQPSSINTIHTESQTEPIEIIQITQPIQLIEKSQSIPIEETNAVINELDNILNNTDTEVPLTPNSEINVIIINSSNIEEENIAQSKEKPLMQRLFEGKKTAYTSNDLHMESVRIPEELMQTYEIAKKKYFLSSEQLLYATKMIKIDRRGYKQHIRLLCLTSEQVYIITKKDPYPKEALFLKDILGITCTPCKDGFICLHTRETREDRGDWIFLIDHPCEFITQLFMAMRRNHNDDNYLKIEPKFKHERRSTGTASDECLIEVRPSNKFHIAFENYEVLVIYTS